MINRFFISQADQAAICTNCTLPICTSGAPGCPLAEAQRQYWREQKKRHYKPLGRNNAPRKRAGRPVISYTTIKARREAA